MTDQLAHTASIVVAVIAGFFAAAEQPATAQFDDITRALNWSGPLLGPLSMLYAAAITLVVMALAYSLAYLVWRIVARGDRLTPASGLGFAVAGYGLGQRVFCEFVLSFFGEPARAVWPESGFGDLVAFTRISGLIAFVFGLAMVLAASLWERRLAREAPRWVRPR